MKDEELKFTFKAAAQKDPVTNRPVRNEKGEVIKLPAKDPLTLKVPIFDSSADLLNILTNNDDKEVKLLLEAANTFIVDQAKAMIDEDYDLVKAEGLDLSKLSWNAISNMPPGTRKGAAISEEVWDAFVEDYQKVIVHHGKTAEQAEMGAKILVRKFAAVRGNNRVIQSLLNNLILWYANSEAPQDFQLVYETLTAKANQLLVQDEEAILAAV